MVLVNLVILVDLLILVLLVILVNLVFLANLVFLVNLVMLAFLLNLVTSPYQILKEEVFLPFVVACIIRAMTALFTN